MRTSINSALQGFELLLGADLCYTLGALQKLFLTASQLLSRAQGSSFFMSYVSRWDSNLISHLQCFSCVICSPSPPQVLLLSSSLFLFYFLLLFFNPGGLPPNRTPYGIKFLVMLHFRTLVESKPPCFPLHYCCHYLYEMYAACNGKACFGKCECSCLSCMPSRVELDISFYLSWLVCLGACTRSGGIDKGVLAEAAAVGLCIGEVEGTRKDVEGNLESWIYHMHWAWCNVWSYHDPSQPRFSYIVPHVHQCFL